VNNDDALSRAKQALQASRPRPAEFAAPLPDPSEVEALLARAREAAAETRPQTRVAAPPKMPIAREATVNRAARLVVAIDATASRSNNWDAAKKALHDRILELVPRQYEIALAVYHNDVDTSTPFTSNRRRLRALAAKIDCTGLHERLPEVLARVVGIKDTAAVINITDVSASCDPVAGDYAATLGARGTRVFTLLEPDVANPPAIFTSIASRTGGAVLPFDELGLQMLLRHRNGPMVWSLSS
jgi:hypothetical protein